MARSTARKRALNTLYEADEKEQDIVSLLEERIAQPGAQTPLPQYAIEIVHGVADHLSDINRTLDEHSTSWPLSRMAVIDRNILRIATWELLYNSEVPSKVAIDEAISLAKTLSEADSPSFVHGILSAIERDQELEEATKATKAERMEEAAKISSVAEKEAILTTADESKDDSALPNTLDYKKSEHEEQGIPLDDMSFTLPQEL
jgi:transcription antitermination protein NusB